MMSGPRARKSSPADSCTLVIFGVTGDLTHRLLIPALYNLAASGLLPKVFALVGVARGKMSEDALRTDLRQSLTQFATRPVDEKIADRLFAHVSFVPGAADDPQTYERLRAELEQIESANETGGNRLFYLATPPVAFAPIGRHLGKSGLAREENGAWRRVIIEKPFGTDLASAQALNQALLQVLDEHQLYRIDHYLGKETVQNLLVLRFANGLFEPIWNRNHIDHVQITVAETVDVGRRGKFYDITGALRDMVPNHLFQLLSLIAMEPPSRFEARAVRSEKAEVLDAIQALTEDEALHNSVRGQYEAGRVNGKAVSSYRDSPDIKSESTTETYVALKLLIDNWRWAGVPFYLRTGKALGARLTEVAIKFKQAPFAMFRDMPIDTMAPNFLVARIQPEECISLQFNAKVPGPAVVLDGVGMTFRYKDYFDAKPSTGYETLIYDCMIGDAILFQRADGIEAGWRVVEPFLKAWKRENANGLKLYKAGTSGPKAADDLIERDGREWRPIT
jgi:glucose-6-phosphate 1-dehydrogenase